MTFFIKLNDIAAATGGPPEAQVALGCGERHRDRPAVISAHVAVVVGAGVAWIGEGGVGDAGATEGVKSFWSVIADTAYSQAVQYDVFCVGVAKVVFQSVEADHGAIATELGVHGEFIFAVDG